MTPIDLQISKHLQGHHVLTLCVCDELGLWCANCFYAFDAAPADLIVLTSTQTRHGARMLEVPKIAGAIAGQPARLTEICGIQFTANCERLDDAAAGQALALYVARHPLARLMKSDVWRLHLTSIKYTDNAIAFGRKLHWNRDE